MIADSQRAAACLSLLGLLVAACETRTTGLPEWTLERELAIGSEESTEYALTRVAAISIDRTGNMYVSQPQDRTVRVFTADGEFVRYIGRSGEGPGEFDRLFQTGLRGDTLWASDATSVARFTLDGELIRDEPIRFTATDDPQIRTPGVDYILADGSYAMSVSFLPSRNSSDWPDEIPMFVMSPAGELTHQIGAFDLEPLRMFQGPSGPGMAFIPFHPFFLYRQAPDGSSYVFIRQRPPTSDAISTFRVVRIGFMGDTLFARDVEYQPAAVSETVRDSVIQAITGEGENRRSADEVRARLEAAPVPEYYAPVRAAIVGHDESIWLHMQGRPHGEWLVLDGSGSPRARVSGPLELQILAANADRIWGVELDAYDVPVVVRYRIIR